MRLLNWFRRNNRRRQSPPTPPSPAEVVELWRRITVDDPKSWVLFRHGTCVVLSDPAPAPRARALELLKEWGLVHVGSPAADFNVLTLRNQPGWLVTSHHPAILTYVGPGEVPAGVKGGLVVGIYGRSKRDQDAGELDVIHIEGRRDAA